MVKNPCYKLQNKLMVSMYLLLAPKDLLSTNSCGILPEVFCLVDEIEEKTPSWDDNVDVDLYLHTILTDE